MPTARSMEDKYELHQLVCREKVGKVWELNGVVEIKLDYLDYNSQKVL